MATSDAQRLQRTGAVIIFCFVLVAYTLQTELAQAIQHTYHKPCFLLYLTHSGFVLIFPIRLLVLRLSGKSRTHIGVLLEQLAATLKAHLNSQIHPDAAKPNGYIGVNGVLSKPNGRPSEAVKEDATPLTLDVDGEGLPTHVTPTDDDEDDDSDDESLSPFPIRYFLICTFLTTLLITLPALSWYVAVSLTNTTIVTALFNTNALWALVLSHYLLEPAGTTWQRKRLVSVACAVVGVFVIAAGDYSRQQASDRKQDEATSTGGHLAGSLLALFGSFGYAAYEVVYKWKIALPEPHDGSAASAVKLSVHSHPDAEHDDDLADTSVRHHHRQPSVDPNRPLLASRPSLSSLLLPTTTRPVDLSAISPTIFLLHADLTTSLIGLTTVLFLWIPLPILNALGWEKFEWPPAEVRWEVVGVVAMGVVFNAGFMILLGLWGPVTTSVGNLCTLVLVALFDFVATTFAPPASPSEEAGISLSSVVGSALILGAFGLLIGESTGVKEPDTAVPMAARGRSASRSTRISVHD